MGPSKLNELPFGLTNQQQVNINITIQKSQDNGTVTLSLYNSYPLVLLHSEYGQLCINRDQGIASPGKTIER